MPICIPKELPAFQTLANENIFVMDNDRASHQDIRPLRVLLLNLLVDYLLLLTTARLAGRDPEAARNIIRRFMWHMNEESGNIGWGIPEAFGESLAASPALAKDFHRVLASYLIDLGRDDNYCDNDLLRRSCYWAVGRLAQARPELCAGARPWLRKGLEDNDVICRGMAAWALAQLPPDFMDTPALRRLADAGHEEICELFDGGQLHEKSVSQLAREALAREVPAQAEADADRP